MLKKHAQLFGSLFAASDLLVVSVAWVLSYGLRFHTGIFPVEKGIPDFADYVRMLIFVWLIWLIPYFSPMVFQMLEAAK